MTIAGRSMSNKPLISIKRNSPLVIPRRKPVNTRIVFLLSLSLQLCVTQSTAEGSGRMEINGRYSHAGNSKPRNHAIKRINMAEYSPVHLAHK
jgi:hypothetical protein